MKMQSCPSPASVIALSCFVGTLLCWRRLLNFEQLNHVRCGDVVLAPRQHINKKQGVRAFHYLSNGSTRNGHLDPQNQVNR